jgi:hypothetical protein
LQHQQQIQSIEAVRSEVVLAVWNEQANDQVLLLVYMKPRGSLINELRSTQFALTSALSAVATYSLSRRR